MKILFVHENHPAQFGPIAAHLHTLGHEVVFATAAPKVRVEPQTAYKVVFYGRNRNPGDKTHSYLQETEKAILNGQGFARTAMKLKKTGFNPDIVMAHSGWGSGTFAKVIWPDCKFIQYLEWWYTFPAKDRLGNAPYRNPEDLHAATLFRNTPFMVDALQADKIIAPTHFQAEDLPQDFRPKLTVCHDGVDCSFYTPQENRASLKAQFGVSADQKMITYATRGMEPHRGFMEFMEALAKIQAQDPDVQAVIAGNDSVHYSPRNKDVSYKKRALEKFDIDKKRTHFVGSLPKPKYRDLLACTDCHIYLTVPFVPSWSLMDAMACSAPIVSSNNEAVREVTGNERKAMLVDHFDTDALVAAIQHTLSNETEARTRGQRARRHVSGKYCQKKLFDRKIKIFEKMIKN